MCTELQALVQAHDTSLRMTLSLQCSKSKDRLQPLGSCHLLLLKLRHVVGYAKTQHSLWIFAMFQIRLEVDVCALQVYESPRLYCNANGNASGHSA